MFKREKTNVIGFSKANSSKLSEMIRGRGRETREQSKYGNMPTHEEVKEVILNELDINFEQEVKFYEFTGDYNIESKKKAIDCISNLFSQIEFLSKSSSILGSETSLFTIRLIPKGQIPNQAEWFDIVIEPIILRPSHFYASVVFRSKNEAKVLSFAKKSESKLLELAKIIQD